MGEVYGDVRLVERFVEGIDAFEHPDGGGGFGVELETSAPDDRTPYGMASPWDSMSSSTISAISSSERTLGAWRSSMAA